MIWRRRKLKVVTWPNMVVAPTGSFDFPAVQAASSHSFSPHQPHSPHQTQPVEEWEWERGGKNICPHHYTAIHILFFAVFWYFTRLWIYLSTVRRRICAFCWTNKESVSGFPGCTTSFLLCDLHPPPPCWGPTMCPHCDNMCRQIKMRQVDQTFQGTLLYPPPPCVHIVTTLSNSLYTPRLYFDHTPRPWAPFQHTKATYILTTSRNLPRVSPLSIELALHLTFSKNVPKLKKYIIGRPLWWV